jgi:hypothetical protein
MLLSCMSTNENEVLGVAETVSMVHMMVLIPRALRKLQVSQLSDDGSSRGSAVLECGS